MTFRKYKEFFQPYLHGEKPRPKLALTLKCMYVLRRGTKRKDKKESRNFAIFLLLVQLSYMLYYKFYIFIIGIRFVQNIEN